MKTIKAIYKIPKMKNIFFICSSLSTENKKKRSHFSNILKYKFHSLPIKLQQWKCTIIEENDFLHILEQDLSKRKVETYNSFCNPKNLELLTINILKTSDNFHDFSNDSIKILENICEKDLIEVFI